MTSAPHTGPPERLARRLGTGDAVVIGLGAMVGAGVFVVYAPAAAVAGPGLLVALAVAAVVAYCNATSSARLAARHPHSGGTYVYGRARLGDFWGHLAGWSFVAGKTASCAAMALAVGAYLWPAQRHLVAVLTVVALTAMNYTGVRKAAWLTRLIVAVVVVVLLAAVAVCLGAGWPALDRLAPPAELSVLDVARAAGLLFFAFAGYARIATLGEEVRDPARTIPRAVPLALGLALLLYAAVAVALLSVLGPDRLARSAAPVADAVRAAGALSLEPLVRFGAVAAALGALLALILGVSRTVLAMARDGHLPRGLDAVHPRYGVPHRAELAVGAVVAVVAGLADVRGAIGFSSFGVLVYYAVANASAWTLTAAEGRPPRLVPVAGLAGCLLLAAALPPSSVLGGGAAVLAGAVLWAVRRWRGNVRRDRPG
ncbi:APC family permease [Sphaerisporangium aureirubrum]|uniref:APC family permease n=1 Tax=Sphaerisporangium aureirubrum TaxID=1544736 RepID=A0ABW1NQU0_9ACTN